MPVRPAWDEYFMAIATVVSSRSLDPSTKHGSVIVNKRNQIVGVGYNGFPRGCNAYPTTRPEKYTFMIHSEDNAISNCSVIEDNLTLYVTGIPCPACMRRIIQNRITRVVYGQIQSICVDSKDAEATFLMGRNHNVRMEEFTLDPTNTLSGVQSYLKEKWINEKETS